VRRREGGGEKGKEIEGGGQMTRYWELRSKERRKGVSKIRIRR